MNTRYKDGSLKPNRGSMAKVQIIMKSKAQSNMRTQVIISEVSEPSM